MAAAHEALYHGLRGSPTRPPADRSS
jgi:hypothetical protein